MRHMFGPAAARMVGKAKNFFRSDDGGGELDRRLKRLIATCKSDARRSPLDRRSIDTPEQPPVPLYEQSVYGSLGCEPAEDVHP